jgi:hypothetical protein
MARLRSSIAATFVIAAVFALASPAAAQNVAGTISGSVTDSSGQALADAKVVLISEATSAERTIATDARGAFSFPAVQPGIYTVRVEKQGFQPYERKHNTLTTNEQLSVGKVALTIGERAEAVTVTAEGTPVETSTSERSALLSAKQIEMVAVKSRDIMALLKVLPGVTINPNTYTEPDALGAGFGSRIPNIQGTRESYSTITVDGIAGNDMGTPAVFSSTVNFDSIGEVKVQLNNYRAESGRSGGASVSIVTKSGTQEFHGSGYGYIRREGLNANDFFNNRNGVARPLYRYTDAGFSLGGPVFIPGVFNEKKEKFFFFFSFDHLDTKTPQPLRQVTVPTALERQGNFSQTLDLNGNLIVIRDPLTGQPFPGNIIPANRINPNGQALLNRFPLPNALDRGVTRGNYNYNFQESLDVPKRSHLLRLDFNPSEKDSFYVRGVHWLSDSQGFAVPAGSANWGFIPQHYTFEDNGVVGHYTHIFGPRVVNEFTGGWRHSTEAGPPLTDEGLNSARKSTIGFGLGQLFPAANPLGIMPQAQFAGVPNDARFTYDGRFPLFGADTILSFTDNITLLKGSHTFKGGLYYEHSHNVEGKTAVFAGRFNFDRDAQNPLDTNYAYSNAVLGVFQQYTESSSRPPTDGLATVAEAYAQDTWRLTRKLTLDYGLRLAWYTHWYQQDGQAAGFSLERYDPAKAPRLFQPVLVNGQRRALNPITGEIFPAVYIGAYVPGSGDPFNGMVKADDPSYPKGFKNQQPVLPEPRLGFAYDITGNGKTAIRGGFGVFHNLKPQGTFLRNLTQQPPVQLNPVIYYGDMSTFLNSTGVLSPSNVRGWQKDIKTPVVYNFSLGLQRDIGFGTVVDVAYVGSLQRNLQVSRNINLVAPGARLLPQNQDPTQPGRPLIDNFFRPYPGYGSITIDSNDGIANYHSLQVAANRRFTRGFQFGLAYTYSKAKGTADQDGNLVSTYFDPNTRDYDYLAFDQTHVFVLNYTWDLPKASHLWNNGAIRFLFDNWQISGITTFASGAPREVGTGTVAFTTVDGADITAGGDPVRVVVVGDPNLSRGNRGLTGWFDTSVVKRPGPGDFGNASRLPVRGPGVNNWDLTAFKSFPIRGRSQLQVRWEVYNLFNHPQWLDFDRTPRFDAAGNQVNARFGQVISARPPRIMQGSVRFTF